MEGIYLDDYQLEALDRMKSGCILCGGVGSGKSRTGIAYYYTQMGGVIGNTFVKLKPPFKDLYIITTAKKRDTKEWEQELEPFCFGLYDIKVVIDSWNNIKKYANIVSAFFIFDEQHVVGRGAWVKSFLKIVRRNKWILLTATPGDQWTDYIPVFIANGFYATRYEFEREHVIFRPFVKYKQVLRYVNEGRLIRYRNQIVINMDYHSKAIQHHETFNLPYNTGLYSYVMRERINPETNEPVKNISELCVLLRRVTNSDPARREMVELLCKQHPRVIIYYNYDFELDILKNCSYPEGTVVAEWNGHRHNNIPESDRWVYLVNYNSSEGWNCTSTNAMIFYSQNYSYKTMIQAAGRIDRRNTPFTDLYYYHLKSKSSMDIAISRALKNKQKFNEATFFNNYLEKHK